MFKIHFVQHVGMQIINTYFSQDSDSYANYKRYPKFSAQGPVHIHKHTYRHKINWITFDVTCKEDLIKIKKRKLFLVKNLLNFMLILDDRILCSTMTYTTGRPPTADIKGIVKS